MSKNYLRWTLAVAVLASWTAAAARADVFSMPGGQTSVSMVTIGNPGNAPDPTIQDDGTSGYGSVGYVYQMDKYDVTTAQYTQFLNAVAATDTYGLYHSSMSTDFPTVGITQSGSSGSYTYSVIGNGNVPVFDENWGNAARFSNWLQNGQPNGAEGNGTTETGAYTLNGAVTQSALMAINRNAAATYVIPTENEWYKSAYYKGGGTNAGYWTYPTRSNTIPNNVLSATGTNNANYYDGGDPSHIYGNGSYTDPVNYLTPVGAFASSPSAYGTFDQTGDVFQWNEANIGGSTCGLRGGDWFHSSNNLSSSDRNDYGPSDVNNIIGFRVAEVTPVPAPEPGSFALLALGTAGLLLWAKRRKASR